MTTVTASKSPLRVRDFRLFWLGEAISTLGDQFALIALPWLALVLTGDAFALGAVLALMALPRALFMLIGGAYVDRLSPRLVMLGSNAVRFVAIGVLGVIVLQGAAAMWMLYAFALVFGIADAFFYPALTAMVPDLVDDAQLQKANGLVQGTAQLSTLIGPALAGVAIAALAGQAVGPDLTGVGLALLLDAATFVVSLATLLLIRARPAREASGGSVIKDIREGVRFVWGDPPLRIVLLISMGLNLFIVGPTDVGLPVLAYSRLPEGAAAFGLITSAFGGGSLLGLGAAMMLPPIPPPRFGSAVLILISTSGVALAALAFAQSTLVVLALSGVVGLVLGYSNVLMITWIQRRIPRQLMGRVVSLVMFSSVALVPISMAASGALVQISLDGMLLGAGVGMTLLTLSALFSADVRHMGTLSALDEGEAQNADTTPTPSAEAASAA